MFSKNQEVICINDQFHPESKKLIPNLPVENSIYTIRDCFGQKGTMVVLLNEIVNPHVNATNDSTGDGGYGFSFEPTFKADRFTTLLGTDLTEEFELENTLQNTF